MKIVSSFYRNIDRLIKDDRVFGWIFALVIHFWIFRIVLVLAFGPDRSNVLDYVLFAIGFYVIPVTLLDLREARAELARLKADHRA